jgi:hypothetical protein
MGNHNLIGPQVRKLRKRRRWTQQTLAAKLELAGIVEAKQRHLHKRNSLIFSISFNPTRFRYRGFGIGSAQDVLTSTFLYASAALIWAAFSFQLKIPALNRVMFCPKEISLTGKSVGTPAWVIFVRWSRAFGSAASWQISFYPERFITP